MSGVSHGRVSFSYKFDFVGWVIGLSFEVPYFPKKILRKLVFLWFVKWGTIQRRKLLKEGN